MNQWDAQLLSTCVGVLLRLKVGCHLLRPGDHLRKFKFYSPNPWSFIVLGEWHGIKVAMLRWSWWSLNYFCILGLCDFLEREGKQFDRSMLAFTCCFVIPSWQQTVARVRILSDCWPPLSISFFFFFQQILFFFPLANCHFQQNKNCTDLERWDVLGFIFHSVPSYFVIPLSGAIQFFFMEVWVVLPGLFLA